MRAAEGSAKNGKVLAIHVYKAAMDGAITSYDAVTVRPVVSQPEVRALVAYKHPDLFERITVKQDVQALPRCEFSLCALPGHAGLATTEASLGAPILQTAVFAHTAVRPPPRLSNRCAPVLRVVPFIPRLHGVRKEYGRFAIDINVECAEDVLRDHVGSIAPGIGIVQPP